MPVYRRYPATDWHYVHDGRQRRIYHQPLRGAYPHIRHFHWQKNRPGDMVRLGVHPCRPLLHLRHWQTRLA